MQALREGARKGGGRIDGKRRRWINFSGHWQLEVSIRSDAYLPVTGSEGPVPLKAQGWRLEAPAHRALTALCKNFAKNSFSVLTDEMAGCIMSTSF